VLRTAVSATAAALAAMCALAACGPVRMGSAALTGGQRITAATLTAQVSNLEDAYRASHGKIQLQFPPSQAPQAVLSWLLRFQVRERLGARYHVSVTRGDSQRALASIAAQASQSGLGKVTLSDLVVAYGLPPDMLGELGRYQAIQNAVLARMDGGTLPSSSSALQVLSLKFNHAQCVAAKSLAIKVNPQFGRLDYSQITVIPANSTLSAPQVPIPTPSTKPQLKPAC
jgi:hypothetical protein